MHELDHRGLYLEEMEFVQGQWRVILEYFCFRLIIECSAGDSLERSGCRLGIWLGGHCSGGASLVRSN